MRAEHRRGWSRLRATALAVLSACATTNELTRQERDRAQGMLTLAARDVEEHYYDPRFHGVHWEARVAKARRDIDAAPTMNMAMSQVAAALASLNDSHTFFVTPPRPYRIEYGWRAQMVGDRCIVTRVRPGSDAKVKGVSAGQELLAIDGFGLNRESWWKAQYVYNSLRPQLAVALTLNDRVAGERTVEVQAHVEKVVGEGVSGNLGRADLIRATENEAARTRTTSVLDGHGTIIVKSREFNFEVKSLANRVERQQVKAMVLDLRGNPGGDEDVLTQLTAFVIGREVKVGDKVGREGRKPVIAKSDAAFKGKLVVLIDSDSASSSEVLARVVQLEKRGVVLGDRSSGSVMAARHYWHELGSGAVVAFGVSVTTADLIMADGKSLEHTGVVPDELMLPAPEDLAAGRDPVLARAVELAGGALSPEEAGKLFPYEWPGQ